MGATASPPALSTAPGANTKCVSLTGSHFSNVRFSASLSASQLVFSNNQIDHFGDDGIDYAASNLVITKNDIHDNLDIGDGNHEDAMQGQIGVLASGATVNYFENIPIDSNLVIRQSDAKLSFPTYLQGIDAFDEDWTNVTVTNNVVITRACWGIAFASIHSSLIANNTVVADGLVATQGCAGANVSVGDNARRLAQQQHRGAEQSYEPARSLQPRPERGRLIFRWADLQGSQRPSFQSCRKIELKLLQSLSDAQNRTSRTTAPRLNPQNGVRSLGPAAMRCQALEQCSWLGKRGRPSQANGIPCQ
jgi:Right handed beta helix region